MISLLYPGSNEETSEQICDVLGFSCEDQGQLFWKDTIDALLATYDGKCTSEYKGECFSMPPLVEIANGIWTDSGLQLIQSYHDIVDEYALQANFDDEGAGAIINSWVEESTHGLIDKIIENGPIANEVSLVAVNSIYLNATWANPFREEYTNADYFYSSADQVAGSETIAQFMHMVDEFPYSHDALPGIQLIELNFLRGLSMLVALPIRNKVGSVTSSDILMAFPQLKKTRVALALPKFQFVAEYEKDLMFALKSLGIKAAFDNKKGFCTMFNDNKCGYISLVKQKTFIKVYEKGTEAAAVTTGQVGITSMPFDPPDAPIMFMSDHPFQFFIYDRNSKLILFEGLVSAPGIPKDSSHADMTSKHTEDNFWLANFRAEPTIITVASDGVPFFICSLRFLVHTVFTSFASVLFNLYLKITLSDSIPLWCYLIQCRMKTNSYKAEPK